MIESIETFTSSIDWQTAALLYSLFGLITLFVLIQVWKRQHGYSELEDALTRMFWLSMLAWPYVTLVWVKSWPVFSWAFWLKGVGLGGVSVRLPKVDHWWIDKP